MPQRIDAMPRKLQREYDRLVADGTKLQVLIEEVKSLEEANATARSAGQPANTAAVYETQAKRYVLEATLLEREIVYSLALIECVAERRRTIESRINAFVEGVRREAKLPANADVPIRLLQGQTTWWALRAELNACPRLDWIRVDRTEAAAAAARAQADHFALGAARERTRIAHAAPSAPERSEWAEQCIAKQTQRAALREAAAALVK
jgi:hypothetical protein